jgi:hypothetical protein
LKDKNKIVEEHYQVHQITEVEHFPGHDKRKETLEFRNAKKELENVEHLGCFICGTMEKRESHHIFERAYWNGFDLKKVAHFLFHHFDFHGHCKRDFKNEDELFKFFVEHYNGREVEAEVEDDQGDKVKIKYWTCDDTAADTIYVQLILCKTHHRGEGTGAHGCTAATFMAWFAHRDGFKISMNLKEYEELAHKKV